MKNLSRKEAAKVLEGMKVKIEIPKAAVTQWKRNTALDMAIEVLKYSEIPNSSDCINRQSAIDALGEEPEVWTGKDEYAQGLNNQWHYDRNAIMALPSSQTEQRWIPSGKKPLEEGSYLVWMPFAPPKHRMAVAEYCGGYWNIKTPISAWMPLPECYRGEEK